MASGFGFIDYLVVLMSLVVTWSCLITNPERLLILLPSFLTIDFFIPLGSQLTPSRLVPLLIGAWLLLFNVRFDRTKSLTWIPYALLIIFAAFFYGMLSGDAGLRPALRALNYLNLISIFLFVFATVRDRRSFSLAVWGLVFAGMLHGGYAVYQIVAQKAGLPFRGIVYNELGGGVVAKLAGGLRVNGLADEPKRLGYILFSSSLAAVWLLTAQLPKPLSARQRHVLGASAIGCLGISVFTYSSSYFLALSLWMLLYFFMSAWSRRLMFLCVLLVGLLALVSPARFDNLTNRFDEILQARSEEVASGLDGRFVYRQEFYARDYLEQNSIVALTGVGLGRYNEVFRQNYGFGAGYGSGGTILPLNSQILEVVLDLGLAGLILLYGSAVLLIHRLGFRNRQSVLVGGVVSFLAIQSMLISNLPYLAFCMGAAAALVAIANGQSSIRTVRSSPRKSAAVSSP